MSITKEQARRILEDYRYDSDEDGIYRLKVGPYEGETELGQSFVCWSYSEVNPLREDFAFGYVVDGDGEVGRDDGPLSPAEARLLYRESFPA